MKKMISSIKTLAALLMAGAAFTACSSSDDIIAEQPVQPTEQQVYTLVINATKDSEASTRALDADVKVYWDGNEKFDVIQNQGYGNERIGTATAAASATGNTTITATLTKTPRESNHIWFYLHGAILDWTGQVGLLTGTEGNSISEKYDYASAKLSSGDFTVTGDNITTTATITFSASQNIYKFTLKDKGNGDAAISAKKLNIHSSNENWIFKTRNNLGGASTYGDLTIAPTTPTSEIYVSMDMTGLWGFDLTLTANDGNNIYSYTKSNPTFNAGYTPITVKMNKILARVSMSTASGVLAGGYTAISADDAATLAKQCWTVAGGTVYVVYSASGTFMVPNVSYVYTTDGETTATGTATSTAELGALYGEGNTAWFVEGAGPRKALADATAEDVGKVIGADGKVYDDAAAAEAFSTTALALITYVGDAGSADASSDTYKGLALALTDANNGDPAVWCTDYSTACEGTYINDESDAKSDMAGITKTNVLIAQTTHTHTAAIEARNYNSGNHPEGTSAWFLPSAGQWQKMITAAGGYSKLRTNANLRVGDNDFYWSSTQRDSSQAFAYRFKWGDWNWFNKRGENPFILYVRSAFAF